MIQSVPTISASANLENFRVGSAMENWLGALHFDSVGTGGVPYNYENTAECERRVPIKVTVQVYRVALRQGIRASLKIRLDYDEDQDRAYPMIEPVVTNATGESRADVERSSADSTTSLEDR